MIINSTTVLIVHIKGCMETFIHMLSNIPLFYLVYFRGLSCLGIIVVVMEIAQVLNNDTFIVTSSASDTVQTYFCMEEQKLQ